MILEWRNEPAVRKNMYTSHEISLDEHRSWFGMLMKDETKAYFVFILDSIPVGVVGFSEIDPITKIATWAFYASPEAPRGTGSLMEYYALEYAFNELKLYKLRCEVLGFNQMVVKLHTKYGFVIEGQLREAHYSEGEYHDIVHLGIFSQEWQEQRDKMKQKLRIE